MTVAPDGKKAVTNDGRVIDTTTSEVTRLENFEGDVYRAKFLRDGRVLVLMIYGGGNQGTARLLEFPRARRSVKSLTSSRTCLSLRSIATQNK